MIAEAPFRFPISGLADPERLMSVLATSPQLIAGLLRLAEGQDLLLGQLASEGRSAVLSPVLASGNYIELLRTLWQQPLLSQHSRFLQFNAKPTADPDIEFSMRIDMPTTGDWPRWVDLEGCLDPEKLARLRAVYEAIARGAQLTLLEV